MRLRSCLVDFLVKYSSLDRVRVRSLSINLPIGESVRFVFEFEVAIPAPVEFRVDEDVLIVEDCLGRPGGTIQLSFLGIHPSLRP